MTNLGEQGGFWTGSMNVKAMHTEWDRFKAAAYKGNGVRKNSSGMQNSFTLVSGKEITPGWIFEIRFLSQFSKNIWGYSVINMASHVLGSKYILCSSSPVCLSFLSSSDPAHMAVLTLAQNLSQPWVYLSPSPLKSPQPVCVETQIRNLRETGKRHDA